MNRFFICLLPVLFVFNINLGIKTKVNDQIQTPVTQEETISSPLEENEKDITCCELFGLFCAESYCNLYRTCRDNPLFKYLRLCSAAGLVVKAIDQIKKD